MVLIGASARRTAAECFSERYRPVEGGPVPGALESVYAYVPGMAYGGEYLTVRAYDASAAICPTPQPLIDIALVSGPGEAYDEIRIVQVLG